MTRPLSGAGGGATRRWAPPLTVAAAVALLQGCAQTPPPPPAPRVYAVDLQGKAALCTVSPAGVNLAPGQTFEAQMVVGNDGGWCGIPVAQPASGSPPVPRPYAAGLVAARPANGRLHIRRVGAQTRVDYIPDRGFAGTDSFAVRLVPGDATLRVNVTVQATEPAATPAAAAPPPSPPPQAPQRPARR